MKFLSIAALALTLGFAAHAAAADPVAGVWQTQPGDSGGFGHVRIEACGPVICGTLIRAYDAAGNRVDSDRVGTRLIWDMQPQGDGRYRDGRIYAPDRDKTYNARMELDGDRLAVSGCVLGICRGQTWARVE